MKVAAAVAAMAMLVCTGMAQASNVGAMAEVRRNVYGVAPDSSEAVKRIGDTVVFQEKLVTLDDSGALVRFIDDSSLTLGAKSKVVIDTFVFDPKNAEGTALIEISVGTLRWVTGDMPKGGTVIKTPTATLVLRGTDVIVHVHPDGTTDTTVIGGKVEAVNNVTKQVTNLMPGGATTFGRAGTTDIDGSGQSYGMDTGSDKIHTSPEQRRGAQENASQRSEASAGTSGNGGGASGGGASGGGGNSGGGDTGGGDTGGDTGGGDGDSGGDGDGHDGGGDHDGGGHGGGHHGGHHHGGDGGDGNGCSWH